MKFKSLLLAVLFVLAATASAMAGSIEAGSGTDITVKMGDNAGSNKVSFTDSDDAEVASITSQGAYTGSLSTSIGLADVAFSDITSGDSYTNYGAAGDDTIDELFAAIDTDWPSGDATAWDDIGTPDANDEIDMGAYTIELNVTDLQIGDGGGSNYVGFDGTPTMTFNGTADIDLPDDSVDEADLNTDFWQSIAISPAAMIADGTNATDPASEQVNSGPNVWVSTVSDAAGTLEFQVPMPENWDGGNIYVELIAGSLEATPSGTVEFEVSTQACSDDELINNTYVTGDNIQFASTIDTQYDAVVAESDVIAASGAGGDLLFIKLTRDNDDDPNDTSTQDVEIWGARLYYQIDDLDERD